MTGNYQAGADRTTVMRTPQMSREFLAACAS
jgi:hypothetical protein